MDWTLEVVVLPVSDIERAIAFYRGEVGFELIPLEARGRFGADPA